MTCKLGSLFDGSGGFPLAGSLCGIEPVWASEIEPYPIAVTKSRFPNMKHLGDISKINGADIEPVDIITFGSPCQDMSVAGKRAGLKHEANGDEETTRSGLFMEAVRIIKEMREKTNGEYPRLAVWENVPGAFSSNKGEDFRIVLEELIKVAEPYAVMPDVPKKGWAYADCYSGDGWSLAYRVFDAQYWGVPQRRRRIYLVADFRGQCARQILFERKGLRGYFTQSREAGQAVAADAQGSVGADDRAGTCLSFHLTQDPITSGKCTPCISSGNPKSGQASVAICYGISSYDSNAMKSSNPHSGIYEADASRTLDANVGNPSCNQGGRAIVQGIDGYNGDLTGDKSATLGVNCGISTCRNGVVYSVENNPADSRVNLDESGKVQTLTSPMGTGGGNVPMVMELSQNLCLDDQGGQQINVRTDGKVPTLRAETHGNLPCVMEPIALDRASFNQGQNALYEPQFYEDGTNPTLVAKGPSAVCYKNTYQEKTGPLMANTHPGSYSGQDAYNDMFVVGETTPPPPHYIVRRLTPTECARLQGFPDRWGHIDQKAEFTDEEYRFWLDVRKTFDEINGRATKDYSEKQMLTWYNKLHTDSAEYKLWGNGIALPCALYVTQGIADVICEKRRDRMKIYIAGAITNNPNYEKQFMEAENRLLEQGHAVINPVKNLGFEYKEYIDMGLNELMRCDAIYLMEGWEKSSGANLEYNYAITVGLQVFEERSKA